MSTTGHAFRRKQRPSHDHPQKTKPGNNQGAVGWHIFRATDRSVSKYPPTVTTNHLIVPAHFASRNPLSLAKWPLGPPLLSLARVVSVPSEFEAFSLRDIPKRGSADPPAPPIRSRRRSVGGDINIYLEGSLPYPFASHLNGKEPFGSRAVGRLPDQPPVTERWNIRHVLRYPFSATY